MQEEQGEQEEQKDAGCRRMQEDTQAVEGRRKAGSYQPRNRGSEQPEHWFSVRHWQRQGLFKRREALI